jgi:hypothetical protein
LLNGLCIVDENSIGINPKQPLHVVCLELPPLSSEIVVEEQDLEPPEKLTRCDLGNHIIKRPYNALKLVAVSRCISPICVLA